MFEKYFMKIIKDVQGGWVRKPSFLLKVSTFQVTNYGVWCPVKIGFLIFLYSDKKLYNIYELNYLLGSSLVKLQVFFFYKRKMNPQF